MINSELGVMIMLLLAMVVSVYFLYDPMMMLVGQYLPWSNEVTWVEQTIGMALFYKDAETRALKKKAIAENTYVAQVRKIGQKAEQEIAEARSNAEAVVVDEKAKEQMMGMYNDYRNKYDKIEREYMSSKYY